MSTSTIERIADTSVPVNEILTARWSPRAYEATTALDEDKLTAALEAARWAPSAYNGQPWRFVIARRGTALHADIVASLIGFNQTWAPAAAALIVAIAETADENGTVITHASYDVGQAVAHLSVQAHHDGLFVHQMSGFDADAVATRLELEERFAPTTVLAIGDLGDASVLSDALQERERAPRTRRPLAETVIASA
ncbi:nitroreductase family protein [Microbacterium sp.]|uniref:nitroreductase family protein n=1 Tax=Microbacterium sp. TaxID=51671 RepID=UPI00262C8F8D|nr:nitroreductase family protein [Microbacterium sp.]